MASHHDDLLTAGVRVAVIDIDSPAQHAAMVEKLEMPFPYLSDPDRSGAIEPYGLSNPDDARGLAYPALVLIDDSGEECWRWVSRDFADRIPESEVVDAARGLGLAPTTQPALDVGVAEPGPRAMPFEGLGFYLRGARFAAMAMGLRHGHHDPSIREDSKAYVAEMDRFMDDYNELKARKQSR